MVKIFRAVRVVQFVKELRLILKCVFGSFLSLMWSVVLLGGISTLFAILIVQQLTSAVAEDQLTAIQVENIYKQFGTVQQAALTLFKSISGGDDWGPIYDLISSGGLVASVYFLAYMLFVWLSVTNIITAIFVDKAMQFAKPDAEDALLEKHKLDLERIGELQTLFRSLDADKSGTLTIDELQKGCLDARIMSIFEMLDLDIKSIEVFFSLLSQVSGSDAVDVQSFVTGCLKMRGYATNIDVFMLLYNTRILGDKLLSSMDHCKCEMEDLRSRVRSVAA